jgi:hypothetical protein
LARTPETCDLGAVCSLDGPAGEVEEQNTEPDRQQFAVSGRNGSAGEVLEMSAANEIAA